MLSTAHNERLGGVVIKHFFVLGAERTSLWRMPKIEDCLAVQAGFEPEARPHRISRRVRDLFRAIQANLAVGEFVRQ